MSKHYFTDNLQTREIQHQHTSDQNVWVSR